MSTWKNDKAWSDKLIPEIQFHLSPLLQVEPSRIIEAPEEDDQKRNTDLIVLGVNDVRIACRIRRDKYRPSYQNEFTIRKSRPSGAATELKKMEDGWADFIFYGFADEHRLTLWRVGSLTVFRKYLREWRASNQGNLPGVERSNTDGSSKFQVFSWHHPPLKYIARSSKWGFVKKYHA